MLLSPCSAHLEKKTRGTPNTLYTVFYIQAGKSTFLQLPPARHYFIEADKAATLDIL